jgi:hypothetical protein
MNCIFILNNQMRKGGRWPLCFSFESCSVSMGQMFDFCSCILSPFCFVFALCCSQICALSLIGSCALFLVDSPCSPPLDPAWFSSASVLLTGRFHVSCVRLVSPALIYCQSIFPLSFSSSRSYSCPRFSFPSQDFVFCSRCRRNCIFPLGIILPMRTHSAPGSCFFGPAVRIHPGLLPPQFLPTTSRFSFSCARVQSSWSVLAPTPGIRQPLVFWVPLKLARGSSSSSISAVDATAGAVRPCRFAIGACACFHGGFWGHAREVLNEMRLRWWEALLVWSVRFESRLEGGGGE